MVSKQKHISFLSFLMLVFAVIIALSPANIHAATKKKIRNFNLEVDCYDAEKFTVKHPMKGFLVIEVKGEIEGDPTEGGIRIQLFNPKGKIIRNNYCSLKKDVKGDYLDIWSYTDVKVARGKYKYRIKNTSDIDLNLNVKVFSYSGIAKTAKIKKSISIQPYYWYKIGKLNGAPMGDKITVSNKKIIDYFGAGNGGIEVYGLKKGTATVKVKLKNGKTYKCRVNVTAPNPNYFANINGYYTRDNYFLVRFKNYGSENLVIHSGGSYSMDNDYKSYDRNLKLSGNRDIVIKPGKSKKVKFFVKGDPTWPDYKNHTVRYYFTYGGKRYLGSVWYNDSVYKSGNKWYATYWSSYNDKYENWVE